MPLHGWTDGRSVQNLGAQAAPPVTPGRSTSCCPCSPQKRLPSAGTILQKRLFLCTKKAHRPGSGPGPEPELPLAASCAAIFFPPHPAGAAGLHLEAPPLRKPGAKLKAQDGGGTPVQLWGVCAGAEPGLRGEVSGGQGCSCVSSLAVGRFFCAFCSPFVPRSLLCPSSRRLRPGCEAAGGADKGKGSAGAGLEVFRGVGVALTGPVEGTPEGRWGCGLPRTVGLPPCGVQHVARALPLPCSRPLSPDAFPAVSGSVSAPGAARSARTSPGMAHRGWVASSALQAVVREPRRSGLPQGAAAPVRGLMRWLILRETCLNVENFRNRSLSRVTRRLAAPESVERLRCPVAPWPRAALRELRGPEESVLKRLCCASASGSKRQ